MNLQELKEKLRAKNIYPIHLEGSPLDSDMRGNVFIGSLDEYIEAAHVLGASAIFIFTETLEEKRFQQEIESGHEFDAEPKTIDLCRFNPNLNEFKRYIDQIGMFKLTIPVPDTHICFYINEDWWLEFIKQWSDTTERIEDDEETAHAQLRAAQEEREKQTLKSLNSLIRDEDFVRLPTQRSMLEYAKEKHPELEAIDALTLKSEIQILYAKIRAKGLGNRRKS
jgi:hypothetical protein